MNTLAKFFSTILHPLLMPTYVFGIVFLFFPGLVTPVKPSMFGVLLVLVFFFTFLVPALIVFFLYKTGSVATVNIVHRRDRFVPHTISSLVYVSISAFFYLKLSAVPTFFFLMATVTTCMIAVTCINFVWKISAHSTAMGGICAFWLLSLTAFNSDFLLYATVVFVFLSGIVMSARLYLQVHTLGQVCTGFLLGMVIGLAGLSNIF